LCAVSAAEYERRGWEVNEDAKIALVAARAAFVAARAEYDESVDDLENARLALRYSVKRRVDGLCGTHANAKKRRG
jgi:hypothetical protein